MKKNEFDWFNSIIQKFQDTTRKHEIFSARVDYPEITVPTKYELRCYQLQTYFSKQQSFIINSEKKLSLEYLLLKKAEKLLREDNALEKYFDKMLAQPGDNNDIIKILFASSLIILGEEVSKDATLIEEDIDNITEKENGNYMAITRALVKNFLAMLLTYYKEEIKTDLPPHLTNFVNNVLKNEEEKLKLADRILSLFFRLNFITENKTKESTPKGYRTFRNICFSKLGKSFYETSSKIDYVPYKKIAMIHQPFEILNCYGSGFKKVSNNEEFESLIIAKNTGCNLIILKPDIIDALVNRLIKKPLKINISLFKLYLANYSQTSSDIKIQGNDNEKFLVNPLNDGYDKTRFIYILQRFLFYIFIGKLLNESTSNNLADIYSTIEQNLLLYSNIRLDSRGRIYYLANAFIQNAEFERSLFRLPITYNLVNSNALEALINYFITLYGFTVNGSAIKTISWNKKLMFFYVNRNEFFSSLAVMQNAKKKYLFTAVYSDLLKYDIFNKPSISVNELKHLQLQTGIFLDNTASGAQILATLCGDLDIAKYLNLHAQSFNDRIDDLYTSIAELCNKSLALLLEEDKEASDYLKNIDFTFTRSVTKEPVMASFYGISFRKINEIILNYCVSLEGNSSGFKDKNLAKIKLKEVNRVYKAQYSAKLSYKDYINTLSVEILELISREKVFNYVRRRIVLRLTRLLIKTIKDNLKRIFVFFSLIKTYVIELNSINEKMQWKPLCNDVLIEQSYLKFTEKRVLLPYKFNKRCRYSKIRILTENVNKKKNSQSIMANLIHSLDSALLRSVLFNTDLVEKVIHDCYLIYPSNYQKFMDVYIQSYVKFFNEDNITIFIQSFAPRNESLLLLKRNKKKRILKAYQNIVTFLADAKKDRHELLYGIARSKYILYF